MEAEEAKTRGGASMINRSVAVIGSFRVNCSTPNIETARYYIQVASGTEDYVKCVWLLKWQIC